MEKILFNKKSFSPIDNFLWIEKELFLYLLKNKIIDSRCIDEFRNQYQTYFNQNFEKVNFLQKNELDKGNISFAVLIVSIFETLSDYNFPKEEALKITDNSVNLPIRKYVTQGTAYLLDHSENPFETIVSESKNREQEYFGESFDFERIVDTPFGYVLEIKKCLFHEVFRALHKTELQFIACKMDLGWINGINPAKHGVQFVRPTTYATANTCQMWWVKREEL